MKKTLLAITILFSHSIFAQTTMEVPVQPQGLLQRFLATPVTKETVTTGAKRAAGVLVANKARATVALVAVGSLASYNYLIDHPEKMSEFFAVHPELLDKFTEYVTYRIEHAHTQKELDTFKNVIDQLALDQNANQAQAVSITNDPVYQQLESTVRQEVDKTTIAVVQGGRMPQCSLAVVGQLLEPKDIFQNGVGQTLPSIQNKPTQILDVNTFKVLGENYNPKLVQYKLTPDHIPSYGALDIYFKVHGLTTPIKRRNSNLENNTSAIMIPTLLHQMGSRTYGGRNNTKNVNGDNTMQQDASDLLEATILDIATTAYLFYSNSQYNIKPLDYIKNSMVLVERNKLLCMYDVK